VAEINAKLTKAAHRLSPIRIICHEDPATDKKAKEKQKVQILMFKHRS